MATAARRTAKLARKRRTGNRADVAAGGADDWDQHAVVFSRLPRAGATSGVVVLSTDHGGGKRRDVCFWRHSLPLSIAATNGAQDFVRPSVMFCPEAVSPPTSGSQRLDRSDPSTHGGRAAPSFCRMVRQPAHCRQDAPRRAREGRWWVLPPDRQGKGRRHGYERISDSYQQIYANDFNADRGTLRPTTGRGNAGRSGPTLWDR